jgi:hypothetical protein
VSAQGALLALVLVCVLVAAKPRRRRSRGAWARYQRRQQREFGRKLDRAPVLGPARSLLRTPRRLRRWYRENWQPHAIYRLPAFFPHPDPPNGKFRQSSGKTGEHLYVGITTLARVWGRWREHRGKGRWKAKRKVWAWRVMWWLPVPALSRSKWMGPLPSVQIVLGRRRARQVENEAIDREGCVYNIAGVQRRRVRRTA